MFGIAEFSGIGDRKEIAVVHQSWVQGNKCFWPDFWRNKTKLLTSIKRGEKPNPQTWLLYEIRILGNKFYGKHNISIC